MATPSAKIAITLHDREYIVNCDAGQEDRLRAIVALVGRKCAAVADRVGNATEPRHLMLTCLSLADKLMEARSIAGEINQTRRFIRRRRRSFAPTRRIACNPGRSGVKSISEGFCATRQATMSPGPIIRTSRELSLS